MIDGSEIIAPEAAAVDVPTTLVQVLPCALGVMAGAAAWDGLKKGVSWAGRLARDDAERSR